MAENHRCYPIFLLWWAVPTLLLLLPCAPGCWSSTSGDQTVLRGQTMGTVYTVKIVRPETGSLDVDRLGEVIDAELDAIDRAMSTYRPDSELSRFNGSTSTDWFDVSPQTAAVMDEAMHVGKLSGGALDVTIEPLVRLWNFGAGASPTDSVPGDEQIEQAMQSVGLRHVRVRLDPPALKKDRPDVHVDLSSIAKGFAVDCVAERLDKEDIKNYMVEVGGEVRTRGHNRAGGPWQIAIERPTAGPKQVHAVLGLTDRSMATSGDYRNYFERDGRRYCHLIDPRTGKPITHRLASVTVLADRCTTADALATALMVMGPDAGMALAEQEGTAAAFLIRQRDGFVQRQSETFPPASEQQASASDTIWTFAASFTAFGALMLILALGTILGYRKMQCSCKTTARVMAAKAPRRRGADDSPFKILDNDAGGCRCGDDA